MATTNFLTAISLQLKEFWYIYLVLMIIGLIGTWLWYDERTRMKRFGTEILVRKDCYYKRKALARLTDKSGKEVEFIIDRNDEYPGTIQTEKGETNNATLRDPSIVNSRARGHTSNGIPIYNFFVGVDFPIPYRTAAANIQLKNEVRENHPELNWLGDVGIIQGVFNDTEYAYDDCLNLVKQYVELGAEIPDEFFEYEEDEDEEYEDDDSYGFLDSMNEGEDEEEETEQEEQEEENNNGEQ